MSTRATISSLLLLVAFTSSAARAQGGADEQVLRELDDRERTAALNRDVPSLESLWSEYFTVNAPSAGLVAGQVIRYRFTNIWKKEGDTWRLYWRHANVIPSR